MTTTKPKKLTVGQVAQIFGVERRTVQRWSDDGLLEHTLTIGGERRFDPDYIRRKASGE